MAFFDGMNKSGGAVCPICKTQDDGQILLVPIPGTEEGNKAQSHQIHRDCAYLIGKAYVEAFKSEFETVNLNVN